MVFGCVEGERPAGLDEIVDPVLGTERGLTTIVALTDIDNLREPALNAQTYASIGRVLFFAVSIAILAWALALGAAGLSLLGHLRSGRPFGNAAWRLVAAASSVVLTLGVVSQLLAWWSRVAIIHDAGGIRFSTAFEFDPLTVTRGMTLTRLSELVGLNLVSLSVLKNDRARAIRFSTLHAICRALDCEVGELLVVTTG